MTTSSHQWIAQLIAGMLSVLFLLPSGTAAAPEDSYPSQPIHVIVPGAAGGVLDVFARRLSDSLRRSFRQPVLIDNRPGANGFIGAEAAARAKPDGYTVFLAPVNVLCVNPALFSNLPYDPVNDFAPVTLLVREYPILLVSPQLPVSNFADFIQYTRVRPGKITYGSPAIGSPQHIAGELLEQLTGVDMVHIPYKNAPEIFTDLIGGQIDAAIAFPSVAVPQVTARKVRALAVVGTERKPSIPEVPTAEELGLPEFDMPAWAGFLVPAGTPSKVVERLNKELIAAMRQQEFLDWVDGNGSEALPSTPAEFDSYIRSELSKWTKLIKELKIEIQ